MIGWLHNNRNSLALAAIGGMMLALFARIMAYPLRHDEQFYLPAGKYVTDWHLYEQVNFTHLPNLPWLLGGLFDVFAVDQTVLVGRLVIFAAWLLSAFAVFKIARLVGNGMVVSAVLIGLVVLNPLFLGPTGMTVTNNFIPVPFALLGLMFMLQSCLREVPSVALSFAAGVCFSLSIGFKANFAVLIPPVVIAALLVPTHLSFADRLKRVTIPLGVGAVIAGLPTLFYFAGNPESFIAHAVSFHGTAHTDYWAANQQYEGKVTMGLAGKLLLAQNTWFSAANMLIFVLAATFLLAAFWKHDETSADAENKPLWPLLLVGSTMAIAAALSFLPTPSFPQYYAPPVVFALVLAALAHGRLSEATKASLAPLLAVAGAFAIAGGGPMLAKDLPSLAKPSSWTGASVHRAASDIGDLIEQNGASDAPMLTLAPIYAIESGNPVYEKLLLGPFIYRAMDYVQAEDRPYFSNVESPESLIETLDANPPRAILTGLEPHLDIPLEEWALANGYRPTEVRLGDKRKNAGTLYLPPAN